MKKNLLFSQRNGYVKVDDKIQLESMNAELRTEIWNFLYDTIITVCVNTNPNSHSVFEVDFYTKFYHIPKDEIPNSIYDDIKDIVLKREWHMVYSLLEFIYISIHDAIPTGEIPWDLLDEYQTQINNILEKENAGYRFINGIIAPITNENEVATIENAINNSNDMGISEHLQTALEYLSDRTKPDYRNSIKESICAVGVCCRKITEDSTLGKAIKNLEKNGIVVPSMLKDSMEKLYSFTNGEDGIRHELMDEPKIDKEEAYYMLVTCSAFINYMRMKVSKLNKVNS